MQSRGKSTFYVHLSNSMCLTLCCLVAMIQNRSSPLHLGNHSGEIIFNQTASHIHLAAVGQNNMRGIHHTPNSLLHSWHNHITGCQGLATAVTRSFSVVTGDNVALFSILRSFVRLLMVSVWLLPAVYCNCSLPSAMHVQGLSTCISLLSQLERFFSVHSLPWHNICSWHYYQNCLLYKLTYISLLKLFLSSYRCLGFLWTWLSQSQ